MKPLVTIIASLATLTGCVVGTEHASAPATQSLSAEQMQDVQAMDAAFDRYCMQLTNGVRISTVANQLKSAGFSSVGLRSLHKSQNFFSDELRYYESSSKSYQIVLSDGDLPGQAYTSASGAELCAVVSDVTARSAGKTSHAAYAGDVAALQSQNIARYKSSANFVGEETSFAGPYVSKSAGKAVFGKGKRAVVFETQKSPVAMTLIVAH